jgi:hypothetical protein
MEKFLINSNIHSQGLSEGSQEGHLAWTSSSKDVSISKDLGDETIFLKRTHSMNFYIRAQPNELLHEIIKLELYGVFPNITIALCIFVS